MSDTLITILLIVVVIALFNVMIFVHELGHFLAARWRGLRVDRFQIWFGKPIWKKEINGVQYGLGWLPAGGFVSLPQMSSMEMIEGESRAEDQLPPVSPLDKIIVAFAGPLFSLLLAVFAAFFVWGFGKPQDAIKSNVVGGVVQGSPAEGVLQVGDEILKVDGQAVEWFAGRIFDDIRTRVMLTESDPIPFEIRRDGKVMTVETSFSIAETPWYHRRALPSVGIMPSGPAVVGALAGDENKGPAELAGIQVGDEIVAVNGKRVFGPVHVSQMLRELEFQTAEFTVKRGEEEFVVTITPVRPTGEFYQKQDPMVGVVWDFKAMQTTEILHQNPYDQIAESLKTMWITIKTVASPKSKVGVDQLAGPVGIAKTKFLLLKESDGWLRVLAFFVLFNVNLAILNMLPLPVLDGGHIVMAILEWVRGKPLPTPFLEVIQTGFALFLMGFMLYITTKDIGDEVPAGAAPDDRTIVWPVVVPTQSP